MSEPERRSVKQTDREVQLEVAGVLTLPSLKAVHGGDSRNGRRLQRATRVLLLVPLHVLILCRTFLHPAFHSWSEPALSRCVKVSTRHWSRLRIIPAALCILDACGIGSTRPFRSSLGFRRCCNLGRSTASTSCGSFPSPNIPPRHLSYGSLRSELRSVAMSHLWTRNYLAVAQGRCELTMQSTPYIGVRHKKASVSRHLGYFLSRVYTICQCFLWRGFGVSGTISNSLAGME